MLELVEETVIATFDAAMGLEMTSALSPDSGSRARFPWQRCIGSFLDSPVWAVLVISGRSQES